MRKSKRSWGRVLAPNSKKHIIASATLKDVSLQLNGMLMMWKISVAGLIPSGPPEFIPLSDPCLPIFQPAYRLLFSTSPSPLALDSLSFLSLITIPQTQSATLPSLKNNCFSTSKQQARLNTQDEKTRKTMGS